MQVELEAAQGVDLLYGDLRAALGRVAVDGRVAGEGAYAADLDGAGSGAAVLLAVTAAAGRQGQGHDEGQSKCKKLLHV